MIALDENALICDLAETYGIFEYTAYPPSLIAILSSGLPDDSRIKKKVNNNYTNLREMLLASIVDRLSLLVWMQTKDGIDGKNRPISILDKLMGEDAGNHDIAAFDSGAEFEEWRKEIMGGEA